MLHFIMGTAGHIDHGKSSLIKCLTGIDTDRLPEEKSRGMSIDLGFAHRILPSGTVLGIVDVPGHERFLKNMLAGTKGLDFVVLVVSAQEGIKPQTVEHVDILSLLSLQGGIVVLTKADLVEKAELAARCAETADFLSGTFLASAPLIPFSSVTGQGHRELVDALEQCTRSLTPRDSRKEYRMSVDSVFSSRGFGTVVRGTLLSGRLAKGEKVMVMPVGLECRIRTLQVYNSEVREAVAGQRVALNLSGVEQTDVKRGHEIVPPGFLKATAMVDARIRVLGRSPQPLIHNRPFRFYLGTGEYFGKVRLLQGAEILPGQEGYGQIVLEEPCVCVRGDHMVIRNASALFTAGGGTVLDPYPERHRRGEALEVLRKKESSEEEDIVLSHFIPHRDRIYTVEELSRELQMPAETLAPLLAGLEQKGMVKSLKGENHYLLQQAFTDITSSILAALGTCEEASPSSEGWRKEEIAKAAGMAALGTVHDLLDYMTREKILKMKGGLFSRFHFVPTMEGHLQELRSTVAAELKEKGCSPGFRSELIARCGADEKSFRTVMEYMCAHDEAVRISPVFYLHSHVFEEVKRSIAQFIAREGSITPSQARDLLKSSRKYIIPVLEYLDAVKFTRRKGDARILA